MSGLTEYEAQLLTQYEAVVTDGRVLNERGQDRKAREADPALIADYAARLAAIRDSNRRKRWQA